MIGRVLFSLSLLAALSSGAFAATAAALAPSGLDSLIRFRATVVLPPAQALSQDGVEQGIKEQTKHLLGVLSAPQHATLMHDVPNRDLGLIALGPIERFRVLDRQPVKGGFEVRYEALQRVLVMKRVLQPGQTRKIPLLLPRNPATVYTRTCVTGEYPQREYFFYFWTPYEPACQAELTGRRQVDLVEAELRALPPPPADARPRYDLLRKQIAARGELHVSLLFGFDYNSRDPKDLGRKSYEYSLKLLQKAGFEFDRRRNIPTGPFAEMVREADAHTPRIRFSVSLSASDIANPRVFARRAREAFEESDIVIYEGHSGLGGNLNLPRIEALSSPTEGTVSPIRFPRAYQIFYFDSCNSYYFYSQMYALAKRGAKYVDVISNGFASYFTWQNYEVQAMIKLTLGMEKEPTWLDVLRDLERPHPEYTYLVNVAPIRE